MTTNTIAERVAAGAAWLDEQAPGWADRIDLDELAMSHCKMCVLGQTFGDYWHAPLPGSRPIFRDEIRNYNESAVAYGFQASGNLDTEPEATSEEFRALSLAWWDLIEARRAEAPVSA